MAETKKRTTTRKNTKAEAKSVEKIEKIETAESVAVETPKPEAQPQINMVVEQKAPPVKILYIDSCIPNNQIPIGNGRYITGSGRVFSVPMEHFDGEFQRRIDTPKDTFFNLTICDDGKIWLASSSCNKSQYEFHLLNPTTGEIEAKMGEFSENVSFAISSNSPVVKWGENEYLATRQWDQTIYRLTPDSYEPYMTIDFNLPNTIPAEQRQSLTRANVMDKVMNVDNYFDSYVNIIQNKDIITAVVRLDYNLSDDCMVKINTKTAETKFLHLTDCESKQFPYLGKCRFYRNIVDNVIVGRAYAHHINQTERFKHLKDDDNPVLFFYELNLE